MEIEPTKFKLKNCETKRVFEDTGWLLSDPEYDKPSLIRAVYEKRQIEFKDDKYGIYKFADWLPIWHTLKNSAAPVTYKSERLAAELGLNNLYITFSGYWPEKGANMRTASFKETEAYSVCARLPKAMLGGCGHDFKVLVVASAGNTARAFAQVCSDNHIPIVISIPFDNLNALWFAKPLNDCVKIICSPAGSDYFDAIALSDKLCSSKKYMAEGGAKNVARRDGMSTTVLSAVQVIGKIPNFYFQAIGSGTGAIAAYEANLRLLEDGRFGNTVMKLFPSQNVPFTPMYDAWKAGNRNIVFTDEDAARTDALKIDAKVLSNRKPPYSIPGGLFDALKATDGEMEKVTNKELKEACNLFKELEGIDIHPAAGVATSSLIKAVKDGKVKENDIVMLNITGGGEQRFKAEHNCIYAKPNLVMEPSLTAEEVVNRVNELF